MFNGKLFHFDKLQIRCGFNGASEGNISQWMEGWTEATVNTWLTARYDTWSSGQQIGFEMQNVGSVNRVSDWPAGGSAGTSTYSYSYGLNFLGTEFSASGSSGDFPQSGVTFLEFENFEVWMLNTGYWQTQWSAVNWYVGDPGGSFSLLGAIDGVRALHSDAPIPQPGMIPMFNGMLDFYGFTQISFLSTNYYYGLAESGLTLSCNLYGNAACGWRATQDGGATWITPSLAFLSPEIGNNGTSWEPGFNFGGSLTYTLDFLGPSVDQPGKTVVGLSQKSKGASGAIRMMPCGPFATLRTHSDHEAPISIGPIDSYLYTLTDQNNVQTILQAMPGQPQVFDVALDSPDASESKLLSSSIPPSPCNYQLQTINESAGDGSNLRYLESGQTSVPYFGLGVPFELDAADQATYYTGYRGVGTKDTAASIYLFNGVGQGSTPPMPYLVSPSGDPPNPQGLCGFTYWNTVCNPHWSFFFPFQVDLVPSPPMVAPMHLQSAQSSWEVWDATDAVWLTSYFKTIQQTYDLDIIPSAKRTQHRIDHIWPPFNSRALGGMLDNVNAVSPMMPTTTSLSGFQGSYWWGTTGAKWIIPSAANGQILSVLLGSSCASRWTGPSSVTNSQITIPAGQTTASFDLTSWTAYPFAWTRIANQITIPDLPNDNNIDSWVLAMTGEDGASYAIATSDDTLPEIVSLGPGNNAKWSISAAMLLGDGTVSDYYTSLKSADDSGTVYNGSPGFLTSVEKVGEFYGQTLKLTINPSDNTKPCLFGTPTLIAPDASTMKLVPLNSRDSLLMVPNGPSLMIGPQMFYNATFDIVLDTPIFDTIPPSINNGQMSAGDIACLYLSVFLAQQPTVSLHAFMQNYFVYGTTGTIEWSLLHHFWVDPFTASQLTTGFALGPRPVFVMMNTYSILPPLAIAGGEQPRTNANGWVPTGDYAQIGYSAANTRRYIVAPYKGGSASEVYLIAPADAPLGTSPNANCLIQDGNDILDGWSPQYFRGRVSNDELQGDYVVKLGKNSYAGIRPWRGVLFAPGSSPGTQPALLHDAAGFLHRLHLDSNGYVIYDRCLNAPVGGWTQQVTLTRSGGHAYTGLAMGAFQRLYAAWDDTGGVRMSYSDDYDQDAEPVTFTDMGIVMPGERFMIATNDLGTVLLIARQSDGSLQATRYRTGETGTFTLQSSGTNLVTEDEDGSLTGSMHPADPWHMQITIQGDTSPTHWVSTDDGETWTQIS